MHKEGCCAKCMGAKQRPNVINTKRKKYNG